MNRNLKKYFPIFLLPTLSAFVIGFVVPFIMGVYLSFCDFTTVKDATFVGADNYYAVFNDQGFLHALWYTMLFSIAAVVSINVLAFSVALVLTKAIRGANIFRTVFFMPNLIGGIVLGWIWQLLLNGILASFNVTLTFDPKYGFFGLLMLTNWQQIGYMMIIYIAGLQNIDEDVLEAARIDGAGSGKILFKIKIPMVMPSITICTFLTLTNSFKLFDQNLSLTNGMPSGKSSLLALDIYNTFYGRSGFEGVGQAKAVVFFLIVAAIVFLQLKFTRSKEVER